MEFFAWGLISLLPKALALNYGDDVNLGIASYAVLPACLAITCARATHSALFGAKVFIALALVFSFVILPLSLRVEGGYVYQSFFVLLPAPFMRSNYGDDNGGAVLLVSIFFTLPSSILVRRSLSVSKPVSRKRQFATVCLATAAYCGLMFLSYRVLSVLIDAGDAWVIVAIYAAALAHGAYFLALFHDFNAAPPRENLTISPEKSKTLSPL